MRNKFIIIVFASMVLLTMALVGCNQSREPQETGLKVYNWSSSLGAVDNNMDKTKLSFSIDLTNKNLKDAYIRTVELNLGEKIKNKILEGNTIFEVNKVLPKEQSIQVKGDLILDTKNMDKSSIIELEPYITGIKVTTEETINIDYKK